MQTAEGRDVERQHVRDEDGGAEGVDGVGGEPHLLAAHVEPVVHRARRYAERGLGEPRARGLKELPSDQPSERRHPRHQDRRRPAAARHDWVAPPAPLRWRAASNASRASGVSTTNDTFGGNVAFPRCAVSTWTMMSAASSSDRLPAPVPIGGTVRGANSQACACSSADCQARATPPRVTGSSSLWMTAWMTNSAGRAPPPPATTAAPPPSSFCIRRRLTNSVPPTCSSRRTTGVVGSRRAVAGGTGAAGGGEARSSTTTRITCRRAPAGGGTSRAPPPARLGGPGPCPGRTTP